jgi:hypothetical protein
MEDDWDGENEPENQQQQELQQELEDDEVDEEEEEEDILGGDDELVTNDKESLLMRFCPHDSSMLYPQVSQTRIYVRGRL